MATVTRTHRFGLLTPSSNSTQEPEFSSVLPKHISLHTGRLSFSNIDRDTLLRCIDELEGESRKLADADVNVIVFAATAPSMTLGGSYDRELVQRMQKASGKPAMTASTAFLEALKTVGIKRVSIAAPWSADVQKSMVKFMEDNGVEVVGSEVMGLVRNTELGRVDAETAFDFGRRADRSNAEAVMIPGGNWPTMNIVERLEQALNKPVLTNNCVSIWAGLKMMKNGCDSIEGYGQLLRDHLR